MTGYKYDLHVHTDEVSPCGKVPARDVVRMYKDAGYDGVVITDHYFDGFFESFGGQSWKEKTEHYLEGFRIALNEGKQSGLKVFQGMEIRFQENSNDYLVFGIDEDFLKANKELYKLNLRDFRKLIEGTGFLLVQAHPFRPFMIPASPELIDGVEIYNGNPRHDSHNGLAYEYAFENHLLMTSGSDFHQPEDLARGGISVPEEISTSAELISAIKNLKTTELIRNSTPEQSEAAPTEPD